MSSTPTEETGKERSRSNSSKREVVVGSDDPCLFGITFDAVELGDEFERLLRFGMLSLFVELAARVSHASCTQSAARLRDDVVTRVLVDDEAAGRVAEDLLRSVATSSRRICVDRKLRRDEAPDEGATLLILLPRARLVRVHVGGRIRIL